MDKIEKITENKEFYGGLSLHERMLEDNTPAISIALIENYAIESTYTFGVKSKETNELVTANTLFQAASISKPVFAVAVMRLMEKGIIDLEEDIHNYLTDYNYPTYDGNEHKVTLKQILSHYAGFNVHGFAGYEKGQKIPTVEQILMGSPPANSDELKLENKPGTKFSYSGGGFLLAQKIIVDVCKKPFVDIMQELVLSPFSMTNSTFEQPLPAEKVCKIVNGYNADGVQLPDGDYIMPELSAAGLWTTPTDLALFGIEVMKALKGNSKFIKRNTAELMITKVCEDAPTGISFFVNETKNGITFGHSGFNYGYVSHMWFRPVDGTGLVVMQNSEKTNANQVFNAFKDVYSWE